MKNNSDKKFKRTEIGMIPSDWEVVCINDIATKVIRGSGISRDDVTEEGIGCIRYGELYTSYNTIIKKCMSHIMKDKILSPKYIKNGTIVFALTGESVEDIAKSSVYMGEDKCMIGGDICAIEHTENPVYVGYAMETKYAVNQKKFGKTKTKVVHSSTNEILNFQIAKPPKPEQEKIANALTRIDNLIEDYEKLIKKKEKIKQGLMQNLLTGKVRLKGYEKKWIIKELKELGNIVTGTTPSRNNKHYWNGNINWITAQDFKGKYIAESVEKISAEGAKSCRMLPKNSVIVTCIASIGLNAIITKESATNQQINGIICNEHYDNEFIYYLLSYYNEYIKSFASQTAVPIINKRVFEEITILLPMEKQEQQAISKVFSNADNEINDLKIKLNKIIDIKNGMLDNLLTGKIRL